MATIEVLFPETQQSGKIKKLRVDSDAVVFAGRVLLLYYCINSDDNDDSTSQEKKLRAPQFGRIKKILVKEGDIVQPGQVILSMEAGCKHPTVMKDLCAECGADLRQEALNNEGKDGLITEASVPMVHSIPELKVCPELAEKIGKKDKQRLLTDRKLVLLVDLDQTIVHTTNDNVPPVMKDVFHYQLYGPNSPWYHTKLRPGTRHFLAEMSKIYELHICTFGARNYAHTVAGLLDKEGALFSHRILSRDECFSAASKTANLKALFPCGDDLVCIIDDREDVWQGCGNLVQVKPYNFFRHTGDIHAPPGLEKRDFPEIINAGVSVEVTSIKESEKPVAEDNIENGVVDNLSQEISKKKEQEEKAHETIDKILIDNTSESQPIVSAQGAPEAEKIVSASEASEAEPIVSAQEALEIESIPSAQKTSNAIVLVEDIVETETIVSAEEALETEPIKTAQGQIEEKNDKAIEQSDQSTDQAQAVESAKQIYVEQPEITDSTKSVTEIPTMENNKAIKLPELNNTTKKIETPEDDDHDDYLLYLEDILRRIHTEFYNHVDKEDAKPLREIIPQVRASVLKGLHLTFSGLIPTHQKLYQSRAYRVAKAFGAEVTQDITDQTTHLVAMKPGTAKANAARKNPKIKIVNPDWLWSCAERWEHVDERLFPLTMKARGSRIPPPHCSSPDRIEVKDNEMTENFASSINPLMSFTQEEIANMDKEVDEDMSDPEFDGSVIDEQEDLGSIIQNDSDESFDLDGELNEPSVKRRRVDDDSSSSGSSENKEEEEDEDDDPVVRFRRGGCLPDDLDLGENGSQDSPEIDDPIEEDDDREWNAMGAALEREFLSD